MASYRIQFSTCQSISNKVIVGDVSISGTKIRFADQGDRPPGRAQGDVLFIVKVLPHALFTRDGDNLK